MGGRSKASSMIVIATEFSFLFAESLGLGGFFKVEHF